MNLTILSNVNMAPVASLLKSAFEGVGLGGYNQLVQELTLRIQRATLPSETIWIHLDSTELNPAHSKIHLDAVMQILDLADQYCSAHPSQYLLFSDIPIPVYSVQTQNKGTQTRQLEIRQAIDARLEKLSAHYLGFHLVQFEKLLLEYGKKEMYDPKYWYLGRIKYSMSGFKLIAREIIQLRNAIAGNRKKVLILDLDNTLWGGIAGETGPLGVSLSEDGIGKAYRDFQKHVAALGTTGVLLAIVSKNNLADAREVFEQNPMMILKWSDFATHRINWKPKAENIADIAVELNLGLDSFVFIDDNPVEQDSIRQILPAVAVPAPPVDAANYTDWFVTEVANEFFARTALTSEDQNKSIQYQRQALREAAASSLSVTDYIHSLQIKITVHKNPQGHLSRIAQLTQKTNQFNLTTRRYTEADIRQFIESETADVFALEYEDRFGKEGIIGVIICVYAQHSVSLDTFLLSCRVIGRNVEHRFLLELCHRHLPPSITHLKGEYLPTAKNELVKNLYKECGLIFSNGTWSAPVSNVIQQLQLLLANHNPQPEEMIAK